MANPTAMEPLTACTYETAATAATLTMDARRRYTITHTSDDADVVYLGINGVTAAAVSGAGDSDLITLLDDTTIELGPGIASLSIICAGNTPSIIIKAHEFYPLV